MKNVHVGWGPVGMTKIMFKENSKLILNKTFITLELDSTFKLSINSEYEETPVWKSSNESVVIVDQSGNISVVGYGVADIIVTSGQLKGVCKISVPKPNQPDIPTEPDEPSVKLDNTKIYYGAIDMPEDFEGYSDFTEEDLLIAYKENKLMAIDLERLENIPFRAEELQCAIVLIPKTSNYKAFKVELGNEKVFHQADTEIQANGEVIIGDFKIFGELVINSIGLNLILNVHE